MSGVSHNSQDDLTTDAYPSPPRDEASKEDNTSSTKIVDEEEINTNNYSYKIPKSRGFAKAKKNTSGFAASVININNSNGIHIGSNYTVVMNKPDKASTKNKDILETEAVKALFNCKTALIPDDLLFISTHMDEGWRDTARSLNYSDGQISQFYEQYFHIGIKEVIYKLLLDWIQNEPDEATKAKLAKTLWERNQKDAVLRWSKR